MKKKYILFCGILTLTFCMGILAGCGNTENNGNAQTSSSLSESISKTRNTTEENEIETKQKTVDFSVIPDGFRVVTIGSGSPGTDLERGNASTLVQYQDKYFLVDCGYGTCQTLTELGLGVEQIHNVLFTHQHEDHNADFNHFLLSGWYHTPEGRTSITVVGPQTQLLYDSVYMINKDDIDGRIAVGSMQEAGISEAGISENVQIYDVTDTDYSMELDGVQIDMHKVTHGNMQAYSIRFSAGNQSVVVTGDLGYTDDLSSFYKDTDILVVDSMTLTGYFSQMPEKQVENIMTGNHMTKGQMAKIFADSAAKNVILSHANGEYDDLQATMQYFKENGCQGEIYAAYDGFTLEP
ncbi:ribonuclease Z [uncultured Roseburia sp.]|uniref:MBL fold metallo-hydrolase n=1 Tax=Brotonthovivens ammoniilytica TaxID=2981725 RepID=A0ABT2TFD4_9FIRM|nr:MBL fold metallo-hydrolase [Brotonthovivens ammoniilytica]MCU6760857.1 MBL fold metallo-hydrolase [Brotonthovivens ammoniilytica]SCI11368.1 ribonuclease Z [uncultured Roseburia sp.]